MNLLLIVFGLFLSLAKAEFDETSTTSTSNKTTIVEFRNRNQVKKINVTFEAFTPRGLKITVPSIHGIDLFSFQAKVNLPLLKREEGTIVWEIINPLQDNLIKEFPNEQLLIGDIINFWVRIQTNGVSLQSESFSHIIKVLLSVVIAFSLTFSAKIGNRLRFRYESTNINFPLDIEVFEPKGLRVSIPHKDGLEIFSFHGSVESPFSDSRMDRDGGSFAHDVTGSMNGLWTYENCDIKLEIGDVLKYWVFLQYKGAGQRFNDLSYTVKKLVSNSSVQGSASNSVNRWQTTRAPIISAFRPATTTPSPLPVVYPRPSAITYSEPPIRSQNTEKQCECNGDTLREVLTQMNVTVAKMRALEEVVHPLEEKLSSLTETVVELIKNMDIGTKLLLTGNLPSRTNPVEDVRHLIVEKLKLFDLSRTILQAEYKSNGIAFEVSSSIDKLRILKRSNDILSKLSYQIVDPERPVFDVRTARK